MSSAHLASDCCGIVDFKGADETQKAIRTLQDTMVQGRPLFLREHRKDPRPFSRLQDVSQFYKSDTFSRGTRSCGRRLSRIRSRDTVCSRSTGDGGQAGRCVYVGNLLHRVCWQDLNDHMRRAGSVLQCNIFPERGTRFGSKGCGLVAYATAAEALRAILQLHDREPKGRLVFVHEDREAKHGVSASRGHSELEADWAPWYASQPRGSAVGGRVSVRTVAYKFKSQDLMGLVREAGNFVDCDIASEPNNVCVSESCGIMDFALHADAKRALRITRDRPFERRPLSLREDGQA